MKKVSLFKISEVTPVGTHAPKPIYDLERNNHIFKTGPVI